MIAFILASGPSLTHADLERVRIAGGESFAVNSTIFAAPWADVCFAIDHQWWKQYHHRVKDLPCERWSCSPNCAQFGVQIVAKNPKDKPLVDGVAGNNSGTLAAELAYLRGADEIVLLGVDCAFPGGRKHHHADHPRPLSNPDKTDHWAADWERFARLCPVRVVNTSPICELECFERMSLEEYLGY